MNNSALYGFLKEIKNDSPKPSIVPDIDYDSEGKFYVAAYHFNHEVRVFDADDDQILKRYKNPESKLDWPHAILLAGKYMIVSNKHVNPQQPSIINIYNLEEDSLAPIMTFETPFPELREAHSMAIKDNVLLITYTGVEAGQHALVSYLFDTDTGKIEKPLCIVKEWFDKKGVAPKGVCFSPKGDEIYVTFVTEKNSSMLYKFKRALRYFNEENGLRRLLYTTKQMLKKMLGIAKVVDHNSILNGIAIYKIDNEGIIQKEPSHVRYSDEYTRYENILFSGNTCLIVDTINNKVEIHEYDGNGISDTPSQVIEDHLQLPHDACFSPDCNKIIIANFGIDTTEKIPEWGKYTVPRTDNITVFSRNN